MLYRRDTNALDQHRLSQHFNMAHFRTLYGQKDFKVGNTIEPMIPISNKSELGLHQIYMLSKADSKLECGQVGEYADKEWLLIYEDPQPHKAFKKHLAQEVAGYADLFKGAEPVPFAFLGQINITNTSKLSTYISGFYSVDKVAYNSFFVFSKNHTSQKIERYFKFMYQNLQWQVDTVFAGILPGVVVCVCKQIPIAATNDNHDRKEDVDTKYANFDYVVRVSGDTRILVDTEQEYVFEVRNKETGDIEHIPLTAAGGDYCSAETTNNKIVVKGLKIGTDTITLTNTQYNITHKFQVEVISLW